MKKLKVLYGICGLGNGHTYRQLPVVEHFAHIAEVIIFAHDNSYIVYLEKFKDNPSVKVVEVAIPFYVGDKNGINFSASAESPVNKKNIFQINCAALDRAHKELGKPDLVISDYESVSAQYAYAHDVPLVTIDQQSKYLCGEFPEEVGGFTFKDEIERLHMFFPKVHTRIACSFFKVPQLPKKDTVQLFPPTLKKSVLSMKRNPKNNSIVVYISSAREFGQTPEEIIALCTEQKIGEFHIFLGQETPKIPKEGLRKGINVYTHGDPRFDEVIQECTGIISTAGHSLLSEAMYLGIPVYAIPVSPYEQHMNAYVIDSNGFGISHPKIDKEKLSYFIENIPKFANNISSDTEVLMRGIGQEEIIKFLEKNFGT